ncbi:COX15/CtaA family protein [Fulvimarina sp. 2208YS6-2-32]|uniref:Heme A synthase n=1 Tax=Fulvimarina uroteuthidis TaxID=3098149 RepID=A0ABU5HY57_9HYPH|nr:COX15/CtaA family protein [Fulvimarina sp. 2208YS6-2-32]MDY8107817.1 COX15/CtaA family protein [Fulvimarina sp. 2208YS6-2-32]
MITATFERAAETAHPSQQRNRTAVRIWLLVVVVFVFAIVVVGGATRLTESGLSITEWKPIHGVVPPLSADEWAEEFALYKQIPQYQQINKGMSLSEFKTIYWWEWAHRFLARTIGVVFAIPFLFFWATGRLEPFLKPRLTGILALGALQGGVGWWMVASGLVNRTDVSQYRLATHLIIASFILAACLWVAEGLKSRARPPAPTRGSLPVGLGILALVFLQIYLGGLVAGLNAGLIYNTWPLMDGALIPADLFAMTPAWRSLFEDHLTVQFVHRMTAYLLFAVTLVHALAAQSIAPGTTHSRTAWALFATVLAQAMIGIVTLILVVPISWGLLHQFGGVFVLAVAIVHVRGLKGEYPKAAFASPANAPA